MKRQPEKHYKRPKYAVGLAALLAGALTGCGKPDVVGISPQTEPTEPVETEVQLQGDVAAEDESLTPAETDDLRLVGELAASEETTEEVLLEGDLVMEPEETCVVTTEEETADTTSSEEGGWVELKPQFGGDLVVDEP